jgi:hypothetical protein
VAIKSICMWTEKILQSVENFEKNNN